MKNLRKVLEQWAENERAQGRIPNITKYTKCPDGDVVQTFSDVMFELGYNDKIVEQQLFLAN